MYLICDILKSPRKPYRVSPVGHLTHDVRMKHDNIPDAFYRISVKALVLNESGKFLLAQEDDGKWELPGGGLDFGETPQEGLIREIFEESGLRVTSISDYPSYFFTWKVAGFWRANILYVTVLENFDFTPSKECQDLKFFTLEEVLGMKDKLHLNILEFVKLYNPQNHEL